MKEQKASFSFSHGEEVTVTGQIKNLMGEGGYNKKTDTAPPHPPKVGLLRIRGTGCVGNFGTNHI